MTNISHLISRPLHGVAIFAVWVTFAGAVPAWTTFVRYYGPERVPLNKSELQAKRRGNSLPLRNRADVRSQLTGAVTYLLVYRWVGLEGVMAASSYVGKGRELFANAASMRREYGEVDVYTKEISKSGFDKQAAKVIHYASPAGPIAFFYFSGSLWFVFLGMALIAIGLSFIERIWQILIAAPSPLAVAGWYLAFVFIQLSGGIQQAAAGIVAVTGIFLAAGLLRKLL